MSKTARPICVFALGLVLSAPLAPAAHAAPGTEGGIAGAVATWCGRLVQMLGRAAPEWRGQRNATGRTAAADSSGPQETGEPESSGTAGQEDADNGPMIDPDG
jgi:hypothetical protein